MPTVRELKEHLETYKDTDTIAWDIWCTEDAVWAAKMHGKRITQSQAEEVIGEVHRYKDAELGINWDTLWCYASDLDLPDIPDDCPHPDDSDCYDCKKCEGKEEE